MNAQLQKNFVASIALAAGLAVVAISGLEANAAGMDGSYVGDLPCESGNCSSGDCGSTCGDGSCGTGASESCNGGSCLGGLLGGGNKYNMAGCQPRKYDRPDLFYNYYSQGNCNQANAQMYVSPLPVPHFVGHTFFTYQPFYPDEMMYWHKDRYHNFYDNGRGLNRTKVRYSGPPVRTAMENFYWNKLRLPR